MHTLPAWCKRLRRKTFLPPGLSPPVFYHLQMQKSLPSDNQCLTRSLGKMEMQHSKPSKNTSEQMQVTVLHTRGGSHPFISPCSPWGSTGSSQLLFYKQNVQRRTPRLYLLLNLLFYNMRTYLAQGERMFILKLSIIINTNSLTPQFSMCY